MMFKARWQVREEPGAIGHRHHGTCERRYLGGGSEKELIFLRAMLNGASRSVLASVRP
jgi:hypothetical protein